jgi:hypothetical protein
VYGYARNAIAFDPAQMYPYFAPQLRLFAFRKYGVQYEINPAAVSQCLKENADRAHS